MVQKSKLAIDVKIKLVYLCNFPNDSANLKIFFVLRNSVV